MKFFKKYQLILLLSFLVVTLSIIKLTYKPEIVPEIKPEAVVLPTPSIAKKSNYDMENYPLKEILPYEGETFRIDSYSAPLTLKVTVKVKDKTKITNEMTTLFEKQKIDLNSHNFDWQN